MICVQKCHVIIENVRASHRTDFQLFFIFLFFINRHIFLFIKVDTDKFKLLSDLSRAVSLDGWPDLFIISFLPFIILLLFPFLFHSPFHLSFGNVNRNDNKAQQLFGSCCSPHASYFAVLLKPVYFTWFLIFLARKTKQKNMYTRETKKLNWVDYRLWIYKVTSRISLFPIIRAWVDFEMLGMFFFFKGAAYIYIKVGKPMVCPSRITSR